LVSAEKVSMLEDRRISSAREAEESANRAILTYQFNPLFGVQKATA